eukprot:scaffold261_cov58-Cyclotella_meneghiniana.AAC.2
MTCCANPNNIVDNTHLTARASWPPIFIVKITIEGRRCAPGAKMKGICGEMDEVATIDPPEQIAACSYCPNGICKLPMKLRRPEVLY